MNTTERNNLENLKTLPIFWMSLSSKELFHSNFIAWILKTYPKEMGEFFCEILELDSSFEILNVEREKFNVDISFYLGDTIVLIENKVKSIAYEEQLTKYTNLYSDKEKKYILLSLKKPTIDTKDWQYLEYLTLLQQLQSLILSDKVQFYHKSLIEDYIKFINILLDELLPLIDVDKIQISNLYKKDTYENRLLEQLTNLKMHDFFLKGLFEDSARFLKNILENKSIKVTSETIFECVEDAISITFGMSRSQGLLDIKCKIQKDLVIGIQIQGLQYRQFVESFNKEKVEKVSTEFLENKEWFLFSNQFKKNKELEIYPLNKEKQEFNKFSSALGLFLYRSVKIDSFSNEELFEMICQDINNILIIKSKF